MELKCVFILLCLKESEIQLGPRDCGNDSRIFLLGLHNYSDSRRVYLLKTGCKQVKITRLFFEIIYKQLVREEEKNGP